MCGHKEFVGSQHFDEKQLIDFVSTFENAIYLINCINFCSTHFETYSI